MVRSSAVDNTYSHRMRVSDFYASVNVAVAAVRQIQLLGCRHFKAHPTRQTPAPSVFARPAMRVIARSPMWRIALLAWPRRGLRLVRKAQVPGRVKGVPSAEFIASFAKSFA
jgi:hypothetical protein